MKRVTLTFDNGPTPGVTERVLEHLDKAGLRCSFFVIGEKLTPAGLALAQRAHQAGHWIGNHTLTHSVALGDRPDAEYAATEIGQTQARLGALARPEKLFRPYGKSGQLGPHLLSPAAVEYLHAGRFTTVSWTSVPGDWRNPQGWIEPALADVQAQDWSVVVLHDIANACLARLPEFLQRLAELPIQCEQAFPESVVLTQPHPP